MENNAENALQKAERFFAQNWHLLLMLGLGFYFWTQISDLVAGALEDALTALLSLIAIGGIGFLVTSKKFRLLMMTLYESLTGRALQAIVDALPVQAMDDQIESFTQMSDDATTSKNDFLGYVENVKGIVQKKKSEQLTLLKQAEAAEAQGDADSMETAQRQAGMIENFVEEMDQSLVVFENQAEFFSQLIKVCKARIGEIKQARDLLVTKYKLAVEGMKIMNKSKKILALQNSDQMKIYEMAAKSMAEKYANYLGNMRGLMDDAKEAFTNYRLQETVDINEGKALLDRFKKRQNQLDASVKPISVEDEIARVKSSLNSGSGSKSLPQHTDDNEIHIPSVKQPERISAPKGKQSGAPGSGKNKYF